MALKSSIWKLLRHPPATMKVWQCKMVPVNIFEVSMLFLELVSTMNQSLLNFAIRQIKTNYLLANLNVNRHSYAKLRVIIDRISCIIVVEIIQPLILIDSASALKIELDYSSYNCFSPLLLYFIAEFKYIITKIRIAIFFIKTVRK